MEKLSGNSAIYDHVLVKLYIYTGKCLGQYTLKYLKYVSGRYN